MIKRKIKKIINLYHILQVFIYNLSNKFNASALHGYDYMLTILFKTNILSQCIKGYLAYSNDQIRVRVCNKIAKGFSTLVFNYQLYVGMLKRA